MCHRLHRVCASCFSLSLGDLLRDILVRTCYSLFLVAHCMAVTALRACDTPSPRKHKASNRKAAARSTDIFIRRTGRQTCAHTHIHTAASRCDRNLCGPSRLSFDVADRGMCSCVLSTFFLPSAFTSASTLPPHGSGLLPFIEALLRHLSKVVIHAHTCTPYIAGSSAYTSHTNNPHVESRLTGSSFFSRLRSL